MDLDAPYDLAGVDVRFYRDHGYVKLRKVLAADLLHRRNY
jgi:hypothetical protein